MKTPAIIAACLFSATLLYARDGIQNKAAGFNGRQLLLIANKGQITDQYGKPRRDIDYKLSGSDVTLFVGDGQLHYQWLQRQPNPKSETRNPKDVADKNSPSGDVGITTYRMDVELLGADKNTVVVAEDMQPYYENYYLPTVPDGATAHSYRKITYKNVYPHIDWVLYVKSKDEVGSSGVSGGIKYDFVVHPGGNVAAIQLQYNGATGLELKDGALVATTPYGSITEDAPYSYMAETGQAVNSRFVLQGNVLSYATATNENTGTFVIDPALRWATYYGGSNPEQIYCLKTDTSGNVFTSGMTYSTSNIATTGAHQSVFGGGTYDGFLVKFNENGIRQWATYYGGNSSGDIMHGFALDIPGNIYWVGTLGTAGFATAGAFQSVLLGGSDAILIKLNNAGVRQWATYFGTDTSDVGGGVTCDNSGNVYISGDGLPSTTMNLSTPGAMQTTYDKAFLAKFSSTGLRLWCTYFPAGGALHGDNFGNIYLYGRTDVTTGITTTGAFQPSFSGTAGTNNSFIVKFSSTGSRLWGTYYGSGSFSTTLNDDRIEALTTDNMGNIYACGMGRPGSGLGTAGSHQPGFGGGASDGFIVKFSPAGTRQWATYYGGGSGSTMESINGIVADDKNDIYVVGSTSTGSSAIATANAYQPSYAGNTDMFFAKFTGSGARQYGSYFGSSSGSESTIYVSHFGGLISYRSGKITFCGNANYFSNGLATAGAHQSSISGTYDDAIIVQFDADTSVYIRQPFADTVVCSGDTLSIPYGVTQSFRSSNNFIFELSNASGSFATGVTTIGTLTGAQNGGTYHWVVPHSTAQSNAYRVRIRSTGPVDTANMEYNIRITTTPQSVNATHNTPICSGNTINLGSSTATSGVSYSWAGPNSYSSNLQNPSITNAQVLQSGNYMVTFTNNGCISKDTAAVVVNLTPVTPVAGSNGPLCAGSTLQLTATSSSPGAAYNWSGPAFSSTSQNPSISSVTTANSGTYSVYATLGSCTSATTTTNVSVVNGPTINFYPSPNDTVCGSPAGSATLVAVPANPGSSPQYQWYKNGTMIPGATSTNYAASGISTGDSYYVVLTPGAGAACTTPISSNSITMTVMPFITPTVSISANPNTPVPSGTLISFTAVATDAGTNPKYQWKLNGVPQGGATSSVWSAATFSNNDKVSCEVTSSYICPQPPKVTSSEVVVKLTTGITGVWSGTTPDIYPNPAKDKLIIEGISKGTRIQLIDVLGRTVINQTATQETEVLNTAHLIPGNYILQLSTEQGERMRVKITKE
ncbi:MAG: SBBP repeat-containing protein [Flavipsychrobacter sp.]|nr:SBBP repeat-containing protein [Flavipsychrobacter sp.]